MSDDSLTVPQDDGSSSDDCISEEEITDIRRLAAGVLEQLPEESRTPDVVLDTVLEIARTHKSYSGPHPSAAMLAELKDVDPTLPNRCMEFSEREQSSRHQDVRDRAATVRRFQWLAFVSKLAGQLLAVVVILVVIGIAAWLIYAGKDASQLAPIIYALAGLTGAIIAAKTIVKVWGKDSDDDSADGF